MICDTPVDTHVVAENEAKPIKYRLNVSNVVCSFYIKGIIDIDVLVYNFNGRYDRKVFPALVTVCHETNTTISCFNTGKIVVSGSRTEEHALMAAHLFVACVSYETCRYDLHIRNFKMENLVASTWMGYGLDIHRFHLDFPTRCTWNEQSFVGASWTPDKDIVKFGFVLFDTGSIVCHGLKSRNELPEAEKYLNQLIHYEETEEQKIVRLQKKMFHLQKRNKRKRKDSIDSLSTQNNKRRKTKNSTEEPIIMDKKYLSLLLTGMKPTSEMTQHETLCQFYESLPHNFCTIGKI